MILYYKRCSRLAMCHYCHRFVEPGDKMVVVTYGRKVAKQTVRGHMECFTTHINMSLEMQPETLAKTAGRPSEVNPIDCLQRVKLLRKLAAYRYRLKHTVKLDSVLTIRRKIASITKEVEQMGGEIRSYVRRTNGL